MASPKPETKFIQSIHRLIPEAYFEKNNNPWRSGTPDVWYSGNKGDLWIEYKYLEQFPANKTIYPELTAQQARWLNNRYEEGRNVAVILGTKTGGVVYINKDWNIPYNTIELNARILSRLEIATWINELVGKGCMNTL
jgi:hypothetical protein